MWKNGQCVTVNGKRYRVKSRQFPYFLPCPACAFVNSPEGNTVCDKLCFSIPQKLGDNKYLEEICGNQDS